MEKALTSNRVLYAHNYDGYKNLKFTMLKSGIVRIHFKRASLKNLNSFKIETLEKNKENKENKPQKIVNTITDINKAVRLAKHIYESESNILQNQIVSKPELDEMKVKLNDIFEGKTKFKETIEFFSVLKEKISTYNFFEKLAYEKAQKLTFFLENLNEKDSRFEFNSKIMPTFMLLYAIENRIKMREDEINSIIVYNKVREDSLRYLRDQYIIDKLLAMTEYVGRNRYGFKTVYNKDFKTAIYLNKYLGTKLSDFDSEFINKYCTKEIIEMPKEMIGDINSLIHFIYPLNKRAVRYFVQANKIVNPVAKTNKLKETYSLLISNNLAYMGENLIKTEEHKFYKEIGKYLITLHRLLNKNEFEQFDELGKYIIKKLKN